MYEEPITNERNQDFSALDLQFISASLSSRTDEEIAEILDKPVELIRAKINDMTGMAGQRQQEMVEKKRLQEAAMSVKRRSKEKQAEERQQKLEKKEKREKTNKREHAQRNREHRAQLDRQQSRMTRRYATRQIDFSSLRSLRIDNKTTVFLEPGDDPEKVKEKYLHIRKKQCNGTHILES